MNLAPDGGVRRKANRNDPVIGEVLEALVRPARAVAVEDQEDELTSGATMAWWQLSDEVADVLAEGFSSHAARGVAHNLETFRRIAVGIAHALVLRPRELANRGVLVAVLVDDKWCRGPLAHDLAVNDLSELAVGPRGKSDSSVREVVAVVTQAHGEEPVKLFVFPQLRRQTLPLGLLKLGNQVKISRPEN